MRIRNTMIIFVVSGFWHGANWTFIVWGFLNALFILPSIIFQTNRQHLDVVAEGRIFPSLKELLQMTATFIATVFCWIFFRAESIQTAWEYIEGIFSKSLFSIPFLAYSELKQAAYIVPLILLFIVIEWIGREHNYGIEKIMVKRHRVFRWLFYYALVIAILMYAGKEEQFIYFQF